MLFFRVGPPASWTLDCHPGGNQNSHSLLYHGLAVDAGLLLSLPPVSDNLLGLLHDSTLDLLHILLHHLSQHVHGVMRVSGRGHQDVLVLVDVAKSGGETLDRIFLP